MPLYRLIFPKPSDQKMAPSAIFHSDEVLEVGALVEHGGQRWTVTQAPLEAPEPGERVDIMVWPAPAG